MTRKKLFVSLGVAALVGFVSIWPMATAAFAEPEGAAEATVPAQGESNATFSHQNCGMRMGMHAATAFQQAPAESEARVQELMAQVDKGKGDSRVDAMVEVLRELVAQRAAQAAGPTACGDHLMSMSSNRDCGHMARMMESRRCGGTAAATSSHAGCTVANTMTPKAGCSAGHMSAQPGTSCRGSGHGGVMTHASMHGMPGCTGDPGGCPAMGNDELESSES